MVTTLDTFLEKPSLSEVVNPIHPTPEDIPEDCPHPERQCCIRTQDPRMNDYESIREECWLCRGGFEYDQKRLEQRPLRKTSRDNQAWELLAKLKGKSVAECQADQEKRLVKGGRK